VDVGGVHIKLLGVSLLFRTAMIIQRIMFSLIISRSRSLVRPQEPKMFSRKLKKMLVNTLFYRWFIFPRNNWKVSDFLMQLHFCNKFSFQELEPIEIFALVLFLQVIWPWGQRAFCTFDTRTLSPWVKRPERDVEQPPPSSAEVKEGGELYIYSPSGTSRPVLGWTYLLPLTARYLGNV
jgi:hypothetical protein